MSDKVLELAISGLLLNNKDTSITWHGGEPTLANLAFYEKAQKLIKQYRQPGQKIDQMLQTNAVLVDSEFAEFFKENGFEVGVSIDGPEKVHGIHRVDKRGHNSFEKTMRGLEYLRKAGLDPSVIITVTNTTLRYAAEVFNFIVANGFRSIKYSPVFDAKANRFSISNHNWFEYLGVVFDQWMAHGDPDISVLELDEVIAWLNPDVPYPMCSSTSTCLSWMSIDPDGTMYPCAYFRADIPYGNIKETKLTDVVKKTSFQNFRKMFLNPPKGCQKCEFLKSCGNGCPATRLKGNDLDPEGTYVYCNERKLLYGKIKEALALEEGNLREEVPND